MTWTILPAPPPKKQSVLESLLGGLAQGAVNAGQQFAAQKQQSNEITQEDKALEALGVKTKGIKSPELRKALLESHYKQEQNNMKAQQEALKEQQKEIENTKVLRGLEKQYGLPEGELDAFKSNPTLAANAAKPKNAPGGVTAQQVPPEIVNKIDDVLNNSEGINADRLKIRMQKAGIPDIYSRDYIENRRRQDESSSKYDVENKKTDRKERLAFHKESEKYDTELRESSSRVKKQKEAIEDIRGALKTGKVKPFTLSNLFRGFGGVGDKLANAFTSAEQGQFQAALPVLLEGWKDVFGVRLSDADLKILENKLPDIGKSKEANEAILNVIEKYSKPVELREKIAREIKEENGGLRPLNFADQVEKKVEERLQGRSVIILTPNGARKQVDAKDLKKYLDAGATLE